jgi:hypothetical protein
MRTRSEWLPAVIGTLAGETTEQARRSQLIPFAELIGGTEQDLFDVPMKVRAPLFEQGGERRFQRRAGRDR